MPQPLTIPPRPDLPVSEDFAALRREALEWLQSWCAETWTDFNESDPGVTLLEELDYALTDLALRASLPMTSLLQEPDGAIPWRANSLYPPTAAFPTEPLTSADYRRLILDRWPEVLAVECDPLVDANPAGFRGIPGLTRIRVFLDPDRPDAEATPNLLKRIQDWLNAHRNLGERFEGIECLPVVRFSVQGRCRITAGHEPEKVLADAWLAIRRALSPLTPPLPFEAAQARGLTVSELLDGPLLKHGWQDSSPSSRGLPWDEIEHRIHTALTQVPGLAEFEVTLAVPPDPPGNAIRWLANRWGPPTTTPDPTGNTLAIEGASPGWQPDRERLEQWIQAGILAARRALPAASTRCLDQPPPADGPVDVRTFEPISNGLPRIYGLGPGGLADDPLPSNRARARQLLGYLLPFEQLAANFAAQLAHTADLFSNQPQTTSDFAQDLYHLPGIFPLLADFPNPLTALPRDEQNARERAYAHDPANAYWQGLQRILADPRRFRRRRSAFVDHLLARFGESHPRTDLATWETATNKERLLRAWPEWSRCRASGGALNPALGNAESGIEQWISHALSRDDDSVALHPSASPEETGPSDSDRQPTASRARFHFLVEHLLFLPSQPPETPRDDSGPTRTLNLAQFRSCLTHVLRNWTVEPLTPAFRRYAEELIRSRLGAHLESRFCWFERAEFTSPNDPATPGNPPSVASTFDELARLRDDWVEAGRPPLRLARDVDGPNLMVRTDDAAARFFFRLLDESPAAPEPERVMSTS